MALQFVLGRSGAGKTHFILDQMREQIRENPLGPSLILLTPEQATFQLEYELLEKSDIKGTLRAQGLSFRRLAFRVMQETGGTALIPITETGKMMLLYKLVAHLKDDLQLYRSNEGQAGFVEKLASIFTEWKRYGIDSQAVRQLASEQGANYSKQLHDKLNDLAMIYEQLELQLANKYLDSEQYLISLQEGLPYAQSLKNCEVFVDGFHGLTPLEFDALAALMKVCKKMTVALTLDRPISLDEHIDELDLFHQTATTCQTIMKLAVDNGIEIESPILIEPHAQSRFAASPALSFLEQNFGKKSKYEATDAQHQIQLVSAVNRRAEVEALARNMLLQAHEFGYRWKDMAILVRNLDSYHDYLDIVMKEHQIPVFLDTKQKPLYHPFVEFIRGVLETLMSNWSHDAVFRMIKTEYLLPPDGSIPREWFDILENYVLASGIQGWKWSDTQYWRPQAVVSLDEEEELAYTITDEAKREHEIALHARLCIVNPIEHYAQRMKQAKNIHDMCKATYDLLIAVHAPWRLEQAALIAKEEGQIVLSRTHTQLWGKVMQLLDELVELCGDEQVSLEMFAGMLESGLNSLKLASIPPSMDQVLVGSMEHTRLSHVKICYIIGASDGVIPMRMTEDSLLSEVERDTLADDGMQMAPSARRRLLDERFIIYDALTKASDCLWVSYPLADEEGKGILPSEIIRQIRQQFSSLQLQHMQAEPNLGMTEHEQRSYLAHPNKAMTSLIVKLREWKAGQPLPELWWDLYNWFAARPEYQYKLKGLLQSLDYSNVEQPLTLQTANQLFGEQMRMSVSRVERFVSCPFQHFSIYGLKLKERKQYKIAAPDMGQLFHAALGKLTAELGSSFGRVSPQKVKQQAGEIVESLIPRLQSSILLSSERFKYVARKLKEIVEQAAFVINEHGAKAEFLPIGTEISFGPGGSMPALRIELDNGRELEIIGRIDRVDAASTDEGLLLRIMDYKSSATGLKLDQVVHGLSLQMLTYLDVLMTYGEKWLKQKVKPAGVLYFHVHNPLLQVTQQISADEAAELLLKKYKMKGLLTADSTIIRKMDVELESGYSSMLPVAIKKDDSFYSNSSVVALEQWETLQRFVRGKIKNIGEQIMAGELSIEPYQLGNRTPCQFCDYKAVCQFDPVIEGNQYRKLSKCDEAEVWNQLRKEDHNNE